MAVGSSYPATLLTLDGTERESGTIRFDDTSSQPATSAPPITSGALPALAAWASGTAQVNPVSRQITVAVEVVTDATNNAATCAVAISPDNVTYTTLATPGTSAAVNNLGAVTQLATVTLPKGWYIKLTFSHVTVAASKYY